MQQKFFSCIHFLLFLSIKYSKGDYKAWPLSCLKDRKNIRISRIPSVYCVCDIKMVCWCFLFTNTHHQHCVSSGYNNKNPVLLHLVLLVGFKAETSLRVQISHWCRYSKAVISAQSTSEPFFAHHFVSLDSSGFDHYRNKQIRFLYSPFQD